MLGDVGFEPAFGYMSFPENCSSLSICTFEYIRGFGRFFVYPLICMYLDSPGQSRIFCRGFSYALHLSISHLLARSFNIITFSISYSLNTA